MSIENKCGHEGMDGSEQSNFYSRQSQVDKERMDFLLKYAEGKMTAAEAKSAFNDWAHELYPRQNELPPKHRILEPGEEVTLVDLPDWAA